MTNLHLLVPLFYLNILATCQQPITVNTEKSKNSQPDRPAGGPCECCEAIYDGMPESLLWETQISAPSEPGEPLEVSGTIFKNDGRTPAEGVILYVYHTDNQGLYSDGPKTSKCAERHGHLRGWMKTGSNGRYRFRTIRPASYPNSNAVQHIHPIIKEDGVLPYWIDELVFDDDPKLAEEELNDRPKRDGDGLLKLKKNAAGTWVAQYDIILGKNVQGY
ncbi:MAG: intradiol ring-cleavage dioxygenase [Saprospiraceae bacterium]|nr:intradiol ring-cleavage dioxygenase [Saprospiraceae bacterium]